MKYIAGVDIETTGLLSPDHRIIEIYIGLWDVDTRERVEELNQRIDPQRAIAADAQRVHGISNVDLVGCPIWLDVTNDVTHILGRADAIVGHNGKEFDLPFINQELQRVGRPIIELPIIDTMLDGRWATPIGKVPNLGELCFACEVDYDTTEAHAADYDVSVMMKCLFRGLEWGFFHL
jgi:DNA polymerase-3 subunit epsilon